MIRKTCFALVAASLVAASAACSSAPESPGPAQTSTSTVASADPVAQWLSGPEVTLQLTKGPMGTYLATAPLSQGVLTMEFAPQSSSDIDGKLVTINPAAFHDFYSFQDGQIKPVAGSGLASAVVSPERSLCGAYNVQGISTLGLPDGTSSPDALVRIAYSASGDTATPYGGYCGIGSDGICRVGSSCSVYQPKRAPRVGTCQVSRFGPFEYICYCGSGG